MAEVTAVAARPRSVDGPTSARGSWDPLIRPFAWLLLCAALFYNFDVIGGKIIIPNTFPLLLGVACVGMAVILPRSHRVYLPMGALSILAMGVLSVLWSRDEDATILWLRSRGLVTIGIAALVLVLPTVDATKVFKGFVRITLLVTLLAVAVDAKARIHIDPLGMSPPLKGWHGWFVHKNVMASFLIFALATTLAFDKNRIVQFLNVAAITFLFVVSDSTTGRMAAVTLVAVYVWATLNRRLDRRSSAAFGVSTAALVAVAGTAIGASLTALADAAGKDLTFTGRTKIWTASWHAILRDPILGHGINGLFGTPYTTETASVFREVGFIAGHAHNGLIDVAVQLGAVGVVLVVAVIVAIFRSALRLQRRSPDVAVWALSLISAIVVMSVGESVFLGASIATLIMLRVILLREAPPTPRGIESATRRRD
ncbi:MAG: O-antigen ligase family protein [Acidimicrobiales bacterium]